MNPDAMLRTECPDCGETVYHVWENPPMGQEPRLIVVDHDPVMFAMPTPRGDAVQRCVGYTYHQRTCSMRPSAGGPKQVKASDEEMDDQEGIDLARNLQKNEQVEVYEPPEVIRKSEEKNG